MEHAEWESAVRLGFEFARDKAEVIEHDGWHRINPTIDWDHALKLFEAYLARARGEFKVGDIFRLGSYRIQVSYVEERTISYQHDSGYDMSLGRVEFLRLLHTGKLRPERLID